MTNASRNVLEAASGTPTSPQSRHVLPLDAGVVQPAERLPVALLLRFERVAHDLNVLLRHRLLRQPHGFEGLGRGPDATAWPVRRGASAHPAHTP